MAQATSASGKVVAEKTLPKESSRVLETALRARVGTVGKGLSQQAAAPAAPGAWRPALREGPPCPGVRSRDQSLSLLEGQACWAGAQSPRAARCRAVSWTRRASGSGRLLLRPHAKLEWLCSWKLSDHKGEDFCHDPADRDVAVTRGPRGAHKSQAVSTRFASLCCERLTTSGRASGGGGSAG